MIESTSLWTLGVIVGTLAAAAAIEVAIPLHARGAWGRRHVRTNLVITMLTFASNLALNAPLVMALVWLEQHELGLFRLVGLPVLPVAALGAAMLDLATYGAHVTMHRIALFWRFHRVHHADPLVDVTTTARQHPGETLIRYGFLAGGALALGVSPLVLASYRLLSAVIAVFEHANIRLPLWLDDLLALVIVSPNMHKVHHSRSTTQTDTNYGNILSAFDRAFATFTPAAQGVAISYGLDGFDDPAIHTTRALLALPFRDLSPLGSGLVMEQPAAAR